MEFNVGTRIARKYKFNFVQKKFTRPQHHIFKLRMHSWETPFLYLLSIVSYYLPQNIFSTKFQLQSFLSLQKVIGCNAWSIVAVSRGTASIMQLNNDREKLSKQKRGGIYLLSFVKKTKSLGGNQYMRTTYIVFKKLSSVRNIFVVFTNCRVDIKPIN